MGAPRAFDRTRSDFAAAIEIAVRENWSSDQFADSVLADHVKSPDSVISDMAFALLSIFGEAGLLLPVKVGDWYRDDTGVQRSVDIALASLRYEDQLHK